MELISTQYDLAPDKDPRFQIRSHDTQFVSGILHVTRGMVHDAETFKEHEQLVGSFLDGLNGWNIEFLPR